MSLIWTVRPLPAEFQPLIDGKHEIVAAGRLADLPADAFGRIDAAIAGALVPYDTALFKRMPRLRVVSRVGIGYDNIVVPDATAARVAVCNTPDAPTAPTAELTVMLMIAASRLFTRADRLMRTRRPDQGADIFGSLEGMQLRGRTLGLVGFGRIGRSVAATAKALGKSVIAYDPLAKPDDAAKLGVTLAKSVDVVLRAGDVVSLHVPSSPENRRMIDARALGLMKKGAVLVNAARGALVDEAALADALKSGHLLGAGLDVFDKEPVDPKHPLLGLDNVVALPHVGGGTVTSRAAMWKGAIENVVAVLEGQRPPHLVNPDVWPRCLEPR